MDNILDLGYSLATLLFTTFGKAYLGLAGVAMMLFAFHLVMVQPATERDERGWSARSTAALMAVPLFIIGFALTCLAWSDPQ